MEGWGLLSQWMHLLKVGVYFKTSQETSVSVCLCSICSEVVCCCCCVCLPLLRLFWGSLLLQLLPSSPTSESSFFVLPVWALHGHLSRELLSFQCCIRTAEVPTLMNWAVHSYQSLQCTDSHCGPSLYPVSWAHKSPFVTCPFYWFCSSREPWLRPHLLTASHLPICWLTHWNEFLLNLSFLPLSDLLQLLREGTALGTEAKALCSFINDTSSKITQ